jgi:acetyltransferase-like isoleucine patch superfamily enzyme
LRARLQRAWARDGHLGLKRRLQKGARYVAQVIRARFALKNCDHVGAGPRVAGRMRVENGGSIVIGDYLNINSSWIPTELLTGREGRIQIGNEVLMNFGTVIAAARSVSIGSGSMIGPHCIISDVDMPDLLADQAQAAKPIEIGERVWLAARVTVRPGVRIGDGAVVAAGSIVERDIPANSMAIGIPARALPRMGGAPAASPPGAEVKAKEPSAPELRGVLVSDFNVDELVHELAAAGFSPPVEARVVSHKSLAHSQATPPAPEACDFAFIWVRPEAAVAEFARLSAGEPVTERQLLADVDAFCAEVDRCAMRYRYVLLATWTQQSSACSSPVLDARPGGASQALATMNLRLMTVFGRRANVFVLNTAQWQAAAGSAAHSPRSWYLNRLAMARAVLVEAARDIRVTLATLHGRQRKLLVLAADDACWQPQPAGSQTPTGEAWTDFQAGIGSLRRRAVLVRTNAETDEIAALRALGTSLHVKLDEIVYVDGRETVRNRVRAALPAVHVPDWPTDKLLYPSALQALRCFGIAAPNPDRLAAGQ